MKIERGYTSLKFGRYLKSLTTTEFCHLSGAAIPVLRKDWTAEQNALDFMRVDAVKLRLRDDWDKYIMQKPTKDMFVNPYEKPDKLFKSGAALESAWETYEETERKVIFEGWKQLIHNKYCILAPDGISYIDYSNWDFIRYCNKDNNYVIINTLEELFTATGGELTIKNVEL